MALVMMHSATIGAKPPVPINELCLTSDPWTVRGWFRSVAFGIVMLPVALVWILIQIAFGIAFLFFIAAAISLLFEGL